MRTYGMGSEGSTECTSGVTSDGWREALDSVRSSFPASISRADAALNTCDPPGIDSWVALVGASTAESPRPKLLGHITHLTLWDCWALLIYLLIYCVQHSSATWLKRPADG